MFAEGIICVRTCGGMKVHKTKIEKTAKQNKTRTKSIHHVHVTKKWRPQGMSVIMFSFLMDFTFDSYVFHFLEWSSATDLKLSWIKE